jgi:hypothetical protein
MNNTIDLALTANAEGVSTLPVGTSRSTSCLVEVDSLAQSTALATSRSQSTQFTVLVNRLSDPLSVRIVANCRMVRINKDDLVELVDGILSNPIRVQNAESSATTTNTFLKK